MTQSNEQPQQQPQATQTFRWENMPQTTTMPTDQETGSDSLVSTKEPTNEQLALMQKQADAVVPKGKDHSFVKGAAAVAFGAAVFLGVGAELSNDIGTEPVQIEPMHAQEAPKTTLDKINDTGRDLANGVITILAKPGSGAEAYGGESVGNKSAVVGPDGKSGTKDDLTKAPESTISYDAAKNAIYVISTQEYSKQKQSSFSSVWLSIKLEADNPITLVKGQPKLEDFKQALAEGNPIDVTELEAQLHVYGKQPGQSVKFTEENGVPHIVVDEFSDGSKDGVTETSQGDGTFDTTANRVIQVAEATIQDLTK